MKFNLVQEFGAMAKTVVAVPETTHVTQERETAITTTNVQEHWSVVRTTALTMVDSMHQMTAANNYCLVQGLYVLIHESQK